MFPRPRQSNQAYHVTVSSQRVKKEWVEKIEETVRLNAVEMEKVCGVGGAHNVMYSGTPLIRTPEMRTPQ